MAEGKRIKIPQMVEIPGIQLNLTIEEASTLQAILGRVGGFGTSRRKLADQVLNVLNDQVPVDGWEEKPNRDLIFKNGGLWFLSPEEMENG